MKNLLDNNSASHRLGGCVFVTGVWKSGNHLVYSALNGLGVPGPYNGVAAHLVHGRYKAIKRFLRSSSDPARNIDVGLETEARISRFWLERQMCSLKGSILGGHAAYSEELISIAQDAGASILCIKRDPRDILISFADWITSRPDFYMYDDFRNLSHEKRIERLLRGGAGTGYTLYPFETVLRRAEGWLTANDVLVVSFEDMIGDKGGGSADRQYQVVNAIREKIGMNSELSEQMLANIYGGTPTFNKGRAGRWKGINSFELLSEIQSRLSESITRWGYNLSDYY